MTSQKTIETCRNRIVELERLTELQYQAMTAVQNTNMRLFKEVGTLRSELKQKGQKIDDLVTQNRLLRRNLAAGLWEVPRECPCI